MSIASRITSIEGHIEDDYNALERLGADLTNVDKNIENIASVVNDIYDKLPKVTGTGSDLSLTPTLKGGLNILPLGNCEQDTYTGKNKFNQANVTQLIKNSASTTSGISNQNNIITITNSYGALGTYSMLSIMNITSGQVTISFKAMLSGTNAGNGIFINVFDTNHVNACSNYQQLTAQSKDTWYDYTATFTLNEYAQNGINLDIQAWNGGNSIKLQNIQVEVGSTATTYEPYVGGIPSPNPSYPQDVKVVTGDNSVVVQNKNLYNGGERTTDVTYNSRVASNTNSMWYYEVEISKLQLPLTFSSDITVTNNNYDATRLNIIFLDKNKTNVGAVTGSMATSSNHKSVLTLTSNDIPSNAFYMRFNVRIQDGGYTENTQIEHGSTATSYVAHQEQSTTLHLGNEYLAGIGEYKDEIVGKTDEWKIKRYVGKLNYNDLSSGAFAELTNVVRSRRNLPINCPTNTTGYCSHLVGVVGYNIDNEHYYVSGANIYVFINKNRLSEVTVNGFNSYVSTLNMLLYLPLETPTEETITDTTLINELNGLQELLSYDGTTNILITSDSNNAQMLVQVSALKGE